MYKAICCGIVCKWENNLRSTFKIYHLHLYNGILCRYERISNAENSFATFGRYTRDTTIISPCRYHSKNDPFNGAFNGKESRDGQVERIISTLLFNEY